jgi:glycosyltransferase involved in cell wall biosynthesis
MKIIISTRGKFIMFDLAREIYKRDSLYILITTYPYISVKKYNIDKKLVRSLFIHEVNSRIARFFTIFPSFRSSIVFHLKEFFDKKAAKFIKADGDLFIGLSSNSLHSIKRAKEIGMVTVVERCSAHIVTQINLLKEEYQIMGLEYNGHDDRITQKELEEYRISDYISVPSMFVYNSFLENGIPESKLLINQYGVNLSMFRKTRKTDDVFRVVYCGAVSFQKGVRYLIEAFNNISLDNIELVIIGPKTNDTSKILSYSTVKNIKYIGKIKHTELYKYFSNSSVFVMPSIQDGFAGVMLQAMACGLPLIATTNTGAIDIIDEGKDGYIIDIRSPIQIVEKIQLLYHNKQLLERMSINARNKARNDYSWDKYGDRALLMYKKILKN